MSFWRPSLSELVAPFAKARSWDIPLESFGKGIDNAHIDVYLSPRLCDGVRTTVRKLILKDIREQRRPASKGPIGTPDLTAFQESYLEIFESVSEQAEAYRSANHIALLQISLLKFLIQAASTEGANLQEAFKIAANQEETRASGRSLRIHERLVTLTANEHNVKRRVLSILFRHIRRLEKSRLERVRESLAGEAWPIPRRAFFNPMLLVPSLDDVKELARAYHIAWLGEGGDTDWLFQTNQCVSTVFQYYLPAWTRMASGSGSMDAGYKARERLDQGQMPNFLATEMLLSRFVPEDEFRFGRSSWLDEPENLRMLLISGRDAADAQSIFADSSLVDLRDSELVYEQEATVEASQSIGSSELATSQSPSWPQAGWQDFQSAVVDELYRCLELKGLGQRIVLLYWLRSVQKRLGRPVPLSLLSDFIDGRLGRRRLAQRLDALHYALDPAAVTRALDATAARLNRLTPPERARYFRTYLKDFLVFRRDLKLAYKTYEAMDRVRLLEDPQQIKLSRANSSLFAFPGSVDSGGKRSERRIRAHAVLKADVRGSTEITEELRKKGLNPASHFGLNFFDPVNRLLPDFGAKKLFVEGDAVIIGFFEREGEPAATTVARACGLARNMLQVVALQNAINRKHGLPQLELGLGISYSDREPNFLYDEGRSIMISEAINRADRLSSSASRLRATGFRPRSGAFRVEVLRDTRTGIGANRSDVILGYNVNGIKVEKAAFFKLQKEMNLIQVRLPEAEMQENLFFAGSFHDLAGREHWLALRYAPVRTWDGRFAGPAAAELGHFFEVVADEDLTTRVRKLAGGKEALPLRGRA